MELVRLPSPPHILSKLLDICHDPDSSIDELAELIDTDAALTGKLIMALGSPAFAGAHPVKDLKPVIAQVGHELVKTMILTSSIQQLFAGLINSQKKFVCNAWLDSLYCAEFARDIARLVNYPHLEDAYLAGLFHDFGQIVFDAKYHEQYLDILNSKNEAETIHKESLKFGVSHTELGASILDQWPVLSPSIADAARFHHEDDEQLKGCDMLCQIVAEASQIAWHWSRFGKAESKWRSRLIEKSELEKIYLHVQDKMAQTATRLGIPLPRSGSLTQAQFTKDIEKETIRLARKIRDASLVKAIGAEQSLDVDLDSPRSLLTKIAREMQLLFSISDLLMLLPADDNPELLTLHEVGRTEPDSQFGTDNRDSKVVKSYLECVNFWIEPAQGEDDIFPISDRQILRRLDRDIALCLPLGHGERAIGVLIIGASEAQKRNLENLSSFIFGYLKNIADAWLRNNRVQHQQAFEDDLRQQQAQTDTDKLAHEIGNPLSVIGNYIDIIKANSGAGDNEKELGILKEELRRIEGIVQDFRETSGNTSEAVYLNEELSSCIPLYVRSVSQDTSVRVHWRLDEQDAQIDMARDALRQVVLNLVKNAVEAQPGDAEIMISSRHFVNFDGRLYAQFTIDDRGGGIDSVTRHQLFSPLASHKEGAGRGLGLSVVGEVLSRYQGQIKYMDNEFGGASFEVLIPLLIKN